MSNLSFEWVNVIAHVSYPFGQSFDIPSVVCNQMGQSPSALIDVDVK